MRHGRIGPAIIRCRTCHRPVCNEMSWEETERGGDVSRMGWKAIQSPWSVTPSYHLSLPAERFSTVLTKPYVTLQHTNPDHLPITIHGLMRRRGSMLMKNLEWQIVYNYRWLYWIWLYFLRPSDRPYFYVWSTCNTFTDRHDKIAKLRSRLSNRNYRCLRCFMSLEPPLNRPVVIWEQHRLTC